VARGSLIVIEGLDGAGTTTQGRRLVDALVTTKLQAHFTREPSDGPVGKLLRAMLAGDHAIPGQTIDQSTFSLLFAADRMDHCQREVGPALDAGTIVVSDRWYHSSLAYQGTGAEREWIAALNRRALVPDLTVFLRVRAGVAAARRGDRAQEELFENLPMQERVADGYEATLAELAAAGQRIAIVDGEAAIDDVTAAIATAVSDALGITFLSAARS
jgi:dTMP kinase